LLVGVKKSILHISEKATLQMSLVTKNIHENWCFICILAPTVNNTAAIWEHASPMPAIHVQCAHNTSPDCSIAIQVFKEGNERL